MLNKLLPAWKKTQKNKTPCKWYQVIGLNQITTDKWIKYNKVYQCDINAFHYYTYVIPKIREIDKDTFKAMYQNLLCKCKIGKGCDIKYGSKYLLKEIIEHPQLKKYQIKIISEKDKLINIIYKGQELTIKGPPITTRKKACINCNTAIKDNILIETCVLKARIKTKINEIQVDKIYKEK